MREQPLVSVLTPVYNGESFLAECIESVLAQSYLNWQYTIVNNCSTDGTLNIAKQYAGKDSRIIVCDNESHLDIISNANKAFRVGLSDSKYCKMVSADDWLFPECISRMVSIAEEHPSVGLVGAYQLSGQGTDERAWTVKWVELPYPSAVVPGRTICRSHLLGYHYVFGSPTSLLYRSDLVRSEKNFYPNSSPHADTSACYNVLKTADFGFVHQVLSYERIHEQAMSAECEAVNSYPSSRLSDLVAYGPNYLTPEELEARLEEVLHKYYTFLAVAVLKKRGDEFWNYHRRRFQECGRVLSRMRLAKAVSAKLFDLMLNPKQTIEKMMKRL